MTLELDVLVFIWVYGCLGAALIKKIKYDPGTPYWKIFLMYVSLPLTCVVWVGVRLVRWIF
ncbi:hypothetical protein JOAD_114 [Erwinia phage vB_EamM_Joad]|uniref:Transmembrane protein n=1 Tax=Erwinia phage vB_EamM_Joad TaxID=2026081 RepID=A0A223LIF1_9CAUD|nr:hypothetical protein JOAD_114 [Erwinia phage vB_EamM_Joad]